MALIDPQIPKEYSDGRVLYEQNLDAWREAVEENFATINLNLTQLRRDAFLSTYDFDNDGNANLANSLQLQINNLVSGATPIGGTTSDTWTINSDGQSVILSTSALTAPRTFTFPDASSELVTIAATQTLTNKTLTSPVLTGTVNTGAAAFNSTTTGLEYFKFISTDASATTADFTVYRNSATPANNDVISRLAFNGNNNAVSEVVYGYATVTATDVVAVSAQMVLGVRVNNVLTDRLTLTPTLATISSPITVTGTTGAVFSRFVHNDPTATAFDFEIYRNSATPANGDVISRLAFNGNNAAVSEVVYGYISTTASDVAAVTATMAIGIRVANVLTDIIGLQGTGITLPVGLASAPSINFTGDTTTGIYHSAANTVDISIAGVQRLSMESAVGGTMLEVTAPQTTGTGIDLICSSLTTGIGMRIYSNSADVNTRELLFIHNDNSAATGTTTLGIINDGNLGTGVDISVTGTNGQCLLLTSAVAQAAISFPIVIVSNNSVGSPGCIDMTTMSAGEYIFGLPADATDPTGGGGAATGRILCRIGGADRYIAYY